MQYCRNSFDPFAVVSSLLHSIYSLGYRNYDYCTGVVNNKRQAMVSRKMLFYVHGVKYGLRCSYILYIFLLAVPSALSSHITWRLP